MELSVSNYASTNGQAPVVELAAGPAAADPFALDDPGAIPAPTISYRVWVKTRTGEFEEQPGAGFGEYCAASDTARTLVELGFPAAEVRHGDWIAAEYVWLADLQAVALLCRRCRR
jgi:hypothetical protein